MSKNILSEVKSMSMEQLQNKIEKAIFLDKEIRSDMIGVFCSSNGINYLFLSIMKPRLMPLGKLVILS